MQIKNTALLAIALSVFGSHARPAPQTGDGITSVSGSVEAIVDAVDGVLVGLDGGADVLPGGSTTSPLRREAAPQDYGYDTGASTSTTTTTTSAPTPTATTSRATAPETVNNSTTIVNTGDTASCPSGTEQYCCNDSGNSGLLGGLDCLVQSVMGLGSTCTSQTLCCVNDGGTQNCQDVNGVAITLPITIGGLNINL